MDRFGDVSGSYLKKLQLNLHGHGRLVCRLNRLRAGRVNHVNIVMDKLSRNGR